MPHLLRIVCTDLYLKYGWSFRPEHRSSIATRSGETPIFVVARAEGASLPARFCSNQFCGEKLGRAYALQRAQGTSLLYMQGVSPRRRMMKPSCSGKGCGYGVTRHSDVRRCLRSRFCRRPQEALGQDAVRRRACNTWASYISGNECETERNNSRSGYLLSCLPRRTSVALRYISSTSQASF